MDSALLIDRLHFAFTITFHYLFPQLTMGLAPLIVILKTLALWKKDERYDRAAKFWAKIFGVNFLFGVITGIPMEFQFGTNWAKFSQFSGGVIATTLTMEGVFAFFLESAFLGLFLYGEKRIGPRWHWFAAFMVFAGSWLSGYFIIVTDAWMQHPVGYELVNGAAHLTSFWALLANPWAFWQYVHNMGGATITGSFVMAALGAFYVLSRRHEEMGRPFLRVGLTAAVIASVLQLFPSADQQGRLIVANQPVTLAAMEGLFNNETGAPVVLIGQPNTAEQKIDNPIRVPRMLSMLTYKRWDAEVQGLNSFPRDQWPDNIPLLYYSYHIMVGLGTIFIAITVVAMLLLLWGERLFRSRWMLWILMLSFPFPYIANTAGWITAEVGRQPWLVYGLMRTSEGISPTVSAGNGLFTLIGFMGMYMVLGILFLYLIGHLVEHGPDEHVIVPTVAAAGGES